MSEELKNRIFKQRIGELVAAYEDRVTDLKVSIQGLIEDNERLKAENEELKSRVVE